jgi:hypothetical protein
MDGMAPSAGYFILASLNSTCLRATGSNLRTTIFSVSVLGFFRVV